MSAFIRLRPSKSTIRRKILPLPWTARRKRGNNRDMRSSFCPCTGRVVGQLPSSLASAPNRVPAFPPELGLAYLIERGARTKMLATSSLNCSGGTNANDPSFDGRSSPSRRQWCCPAQPKMCRPLSNLTEPPWPMAECYSLRLFAFGSSSSASTRFRANPRQEALQLRRRRLVQIVEREPGESTPVREMSL
jgi:hypothetical protein